MENRSTGLVAEIDKRSERMGALVTSAGNNLTSALDERTKTIQQSLSEGQQRIVSELDRMNDSSSGLVAELDKRAENIGKSFLFRPEAYICHRHAHADHPEQPAEASAHRQRTDRMNE
ncbi:MAG: hypothetical protein R3D34_12645 [Nitratireductor sp.]